MDMGISFAGHRGWVANTRTFAPREEAGRGLIALKPAARQKTVGAGYIGARLVCANAQAEREVPGGGNFIPVYSRLFPENLAAGARQD